MKNSQFSTNIELYLRNDTIYDHSYYGALTGARILSVEFTLWITWSDVWQSFQLL